MSISDFWDAAAVSFDDEADHGLRDPRVREAWRTRFESWLPAEPSDILDVGCGTGSLTLLMTELGHRVTGVDLSPKMIEIARQKLAGRDARFTVADATDVRIEHEVDVVVVRHLVWTLPDPEAALRHWIGHCRGRLVLIEGRWGTTGITANELTATVRPLVTELRVEPLSDADLWGRDISDERYCVVAEV
ncbi:class I SAM-dependent methyltransferase [Kibdelosporangium philippinense]|uniref:Class I SAM-dependent methyltransferase n=1 Tax=Kibdelosporangium philippinense TaxID=211113 RepID=A0ABS8ZA05_9PSEU|nr:class I SAM-dependent methyltransferase [Kibdelosporangium philippinense]MCE7004252.1 class I SAM-dependent methyltransferase [Kibdelosporangium philippinense]